MRDVTAALLRTRDCTVHACTKEADGPDGLCAEHRHEPRPGPQPEGVWCPTCRELSLPIRGRCGWCDQEIAEDDDPIEPRATAPSSAGLRALFHDDQEDQMATTRGCSEVPGCGKPTVSDRGRYANVCNDHKHLVTARYQTPTPPRPTPARPQAAPEPAREPATTNGEAPPRITDPARRARRQHQARTRPGPPSPHRGPGRAPRRNRGTRRMMRRRPARPVSTTIPAVS